MKHMYKTKAFSKAPFKRGEYVTYSEMRNQDLRKLWNEGNVFLVESIFEKGNASNYTGMNGGSKKHWHMALHRTTENGKHMEFSVNVFPDYPRFVKLEKSRLYVIRGTVSASKFGF